MTSRPVKARRTYDTRRRQQQAAESRRAVLTAARQQLLSKGFAMTTVQSVAAEAGVSAEFVYKNVGPKGALVAAVLDAAIGGDDEPVAQAQRDSVTRLRELTSARGVLAGYVQVLMPVQERIAPLLVLAAQSPDPAAAAALTKADTERLTGMTALAHHLHRLGGLRADADPSRTRDVLWTSTSPHMYDLLVTRRGWLLPDYGNHVLDMLAAALLD